MEEGWRPGGEPLSDEHATQAVARWLAMAVFAPEGGGRGEDKGEGKGGGGGGGGGGSGSGEGGGGGGGGAGHVTWEATQQLLGVAYLEYKEAQGMLHGREPRGSGSSGSSGSSSGGGGISGGGGGGGDGGSGGGDGGSGGGDGGAGGGEGGGGADMHWSSQNWHAFDAGTRSAAHICGCRRAKRRRRRRRLAPAVSSASHSAGAYSSTSRSNSAGITHVPPSQCEGSSTRIAALHPRSGRNE